jgi:hypothetical protein
VNTMRERFERALDVKLCDLHSRYEYHDQNGNSELAAIIEKEAMEILESYEAGENFLILHTSRRWG